MFIVGTKQNGDQVWVPARNIASLTWHKEKNPKLDKPANKTQYTICSMVHGYGQQAMFFSEHPSELIAKATFAGPLFT